MTDGKGATSAIIAETGKESGELIDIPIPAEYIEKIDADFILLLYENKNRTMKVLPIDRNDVHLLRIVMSEMGNTFLNDLNVTFKKSGLTEMIFTTGVCMQFEKCYYECYFHESTLLVSLDELRESLSKLPNVEAVILKKVDASDEPEDKIEDASNESEK